MPLTEIDIETIKKMLDEHAARLVKVIDGNADELAKRIDGNKASPRWEDAAEGADGPPEIDEESKVDPFARWLPRRYLMNVLGYAGEYNFYKRREQKRIRERVEGGVAWVDTESLIDMTDPLVKKFHAWRDGLRRQKMRAGSASPEQSTGAAGAVGTRTAKRARASV